MGILRNSFLLSLFAFPALFAQSVTLSVGSGSGSPGTTVSIPVTLANSGGALPTGLQWTFNYPSGITGVTVVEGVAATNASKLLSCSGNACLVFGVNTTPISNGVVATATFQLSASASGTIPISLTGVVAAAADSSSIPASGVAGSIVVSAPPPTTSLSTVGCTAGSISTPGSTSCTVTLTAAAPGGGFQVNLSSNNASLTVPTSVTVASGQTTASFTATAATVNTDQNGVTITASAASVTTTTTLNLLAPAQLQSVSCAPSTIGSSATSTCTAALNKAAASSVGVSLSSNNALLTVPSSVTITTGQTSATFSATSGSVPSNQSATVTGSLNGVNQVFTVNLTAPAQLSSVSCSPSSFSAAGTSTCTVTLAGPAPAGTSATVSSNNAKVTVPGSVAVTTGQSSGTFTATVAAPSSNQTATVTVTLNGVSQTATISLVVPSLSSVSCNPSTLGASQSSTCTVTLSGNAAVSTLVGLASNKTALQVPANVTVAPGSSTATFSATALSVTSNDVAVVTATLNSVSKTANINLAASSQLGGVACVPTSLGSNGVAACTVGLTQPAVSATVVALSSNLGTLTVPSTATIAAGQTNASFNATAGTITTGSVATISATLTGQTVTTQVTLNAPAQLSSVSCSPSSFSAAGTSTCTVTLAGPAPAGTSATVSSNNASVTVPGSFAVSTGQSSATFTANIAAPNSNQTVIITVTLNGVSRTANLTLTSLGASNVSQLSALTCTPTSLTSNGSTVCNVVLTQPATNATVIAVSSNLNALTAPSTVTIASGQGSASFSATAGTITAAATASITATLNGQTLTAQVSLGIAGQLSAISCSRASVLSVGAYNCTVTLASPALNQVTTSVAVSSSAVSAPTSVAIGAGATAATFPIMIRAVPVSAGALASRQIVTVTASLSNHSVVTSIQVGSARAVVRGLFNAASYQPGQACSPRAIATLAGSGFTSQPQHTASESSWPTRLGGVQLKINDEPAPLLAVSDSFIQFQCPASAPGTELRLAVESEPDQPADTLTTVMQEATPSVYELDAAHQGVVLIAGTDLVASADSIDRPGRPAKKGESISIYADGLGSLSETLPAGAPAPLDRPILGKAPVKVVIGDSALVLTPSFVGLTPGAVSLFVVSVRLTDDVPTGSSVPLSLNVTLSDGTVVSSNTVKIAIANADVP